MSKFEIYVATGPIEGQRFKLDTSANMLIGRSPRGVNLPDPQVSTKHAEISWSGDRFWIVDLDSATGTVVNGRKVGREPIALHPGMRVEIGESVLVLRVRQMLPSWILWGIVVFLIFFGPITIYSGWKFVQNMSRSVPALDFSSYDMKLNTPCGEIEVLTLDSCFMRETGQGSYLTYKRLRDLDEDGVDELWLEYDGGERIYTFGEECGQDGQPNWLLVADLPKECIARDPDGLADLQCPGKTTYRYESGVGESHSEASCSQWSPKGRYSVAGQTGVTAWMTGSNGPGGPGPHPTPYQFTLHGDNSLSGFLEARGIDEAVHFLVCEDFLPGMAPQVLTESGEIKPLLWGCIRELSLGGTMRERWFGARLPKAIAFTSVGREKLIEQSAVFLSGTPDAGFMSPWQRASWEAIKAAPESRSSILLSFYATEQGMYNGVPRERGAGEMLDVNGRLGRLKLSEPLPAVGSTWRGTEKLKTLKAPCGCSTLSVKTAERVQESSSADFLPGGFSANTFMTIEEVADGECAGIQKSIWSVPYKTGKYRFSHSHIEVEVALKMTEGEHISQVVSMDLSYRTPYPCQEVKADDFPVQTDIFDKIPE